MSYPHSFYVYGWGLPFGRDLKSEVLSVPAALLAGSELRVRFTIEYGIYDASSDSEGTLETLFSRNEEVALEWNANHQTFVPRRSVDSFSMIEKLWAEDTPGFIADNIERLVHLARSGNEKQKRFIRERLLPEAGPDTKVRIEEAMNSPLS
jgi:hypothetical protein